MFQLALSHDGSELIMEAFVPYQESGEDSTEVIPSCETKGCSEDQLSFDF